MAGRCTGPRSHEPAHGRASRRRRGLVGIDVVRAARICSAGHGGQVLLSAATAALVGNALPDGVRERELGSFRLKDIDQPERIYQLEVDGLPSSFPPLRTHGEKPLDLDQRLERRINEYVEGIVEQSLLGLEPVRGQAGPRKVAKLAFWGLGVTVAEVLVLGGIVVGAVFLVRWLF